MSILSPRSPSKDTPPLVFPVLFLLIARPAKGGHVGFLFQCEAFGNGNSAARFQGGDFLFAQAAGEDGKGRVWIACAYIAFKRHLQTGDEKGIWLLEITDRGDLKSQKIIAGFEIVINGHGANARIAVIG